MKKTINGRTIKIIVKTVSILVFLGAVWWLTLPIITGDFFKTIIVKSGILGPILLIVYVVLSHIIAPLGGTPATVVGAAVFGIWKTVLFFYIAGIISASTNFFISRKYGRGLVEKLAGKKAMRDIDLFAEKAGVKLLIAGRLIGFFFFEIVSYAFGLTKISFKKYLIITIFFSAPPSVLFAFAFQKINFESFAESAAVIGIMILTGIISGIILKKHIKKTE